MNFATALLNLTAGRKVRRELWHGRWLEYRDNGEHVARPVIVMCQAHPNGGGQPRITQEYWITDQPDVLASDWVFA